MKAGEQVLPLAPCSLGQSSGGRVGVDDEGVDMGYRSAYPRGKDGGQLSG